MKKLYKNNEIGIDFEGVLAFYIKTEGSFDTFRYLNILMGGEFGDPEKMTYLLSYINAIRTEEKNENGFPVYKDELKYDEDIKQLYDDLVEYFKPNINYSVMAGE